jgi:hypothetical protein
MARKFLTPIDMTNLEVLSLRLQITQPAGTVAGLIYYDNSTTNRPQVYSSAAWNTVPFIGAGTPGTIGVGDAAAAGSSNNAARLDHTHASPGLAAGPSTNGFMAGSDKAKLDAATSVATASTLVMRDASSRFRAADPSDVADVATKGYVDNVAAGMSWKPAVKRATVAVIDLSAGTRSVQVLTTGTADLSVDGANVSNTQRILVKDGTTGLAGAGNADNGIFVVSGVGTDVTLTRATDMDTWPEAPAAAVFVELGSTLADTAWVCTADAGGTLGTTAITFAQFAGASTYTFFTDTGSVGTSLKSADSTANQFVLKGIVAGSSKITLAGSTVNDVAVDVSESNLTLNNIGGTLSATKGGTGLTSYAQGDIIYASAANTLSALTGAATGNVLLSGTAPSWGKVTLTGHVTGTLPIGNGGTNSSTALAGSTIMISNGSAIVQGAAGTTTTVLHGNASGAPTYGAVALTTDVSGTLPVGNGGTGATTLTQYAVIVGNGTSAVQFVGPSPNNGYPLVSQGSGATPIFSQLNLTSAVTGVLAATSGGTGQTSYTVGDILYASTTTALSKLGIGTTGQVLKVVGGLPAWATDSATPAGADTQVQYNSSGAFAASANFTFASNVLNLGSASGAVGALKLNGSTSGSATIKVAAVAGAPADLTLPTTSGSSGYVLTTDGAGVLSWAAAGASVIRASANVGAITGGSPVVITTGVTAATPIVQVYEISTQALVECDIVITSSTQISLTFAASASADTYRWVLLA